MSLTASGPRAKRRGLVELVVIIGLIACLVVALASSPREKAPELTPEQLRAQQMMDRATAAGAKFARIAPAAAGVVVSAAAGDTSEMIKKMAPIEIEQLNERLAENPGNTQLLLERSRLHSLAGDLEAAVADITWVLNVSGEDADLRVRRAKLLIRLGRYEEALTDNRIAASLDQSWNLEHQFAEISIGLGRYQEALSLYKVLGTEEEDFTVAWGLGAAYRGLGDEEKAQAYFRQARKLEPTYCHHWKTSTDPGYHEGPHYRFADFDLY